MESQQAQALCTGDVSEALGDIDRFEKQLAGHLTAVKGLRDRLAKAKRDVSKAKPVTQLRKLVADLKAITSMEPVPSMHPLIAGLEQRLRSLADGSGDALRNELQLWCEGQKVSFKSLPEGFAIGPFALTIDVARESAALHYAKTSVLSEIPLDTLAITRHLQDLTSRLFKPPQLAILGGQIEEAMRVATARQKKQSTHSDVRADLPAVFREMSIIRNGALENKSGRSSDGYLLARFVVEVKTLVQSDDNLSGDRRFRLETAVLENTKDSRKSVFVPNDLAVGYGEGTYYQAIVLVTPGG